MAFGPTEWLILGGLILVIFLFRPRAVSDLARSLGQAVGEFRKGGRENAPGPNADYLLVETAEKLGIRTEGKTSSQIRQEILGKAGRHDN